MSYTYDMTAHFEDTEGFLFMFGISYFSNKNAFLSSTFGSYSYVRDIYEDEIYNNLVFTCLYELDGCEYYVVSGIHQMKSIKSVVNGI